MSKESNESEMSDEERKMMEEWEKMAGNEPSPPVASNESESSVSKVNDTNPNVFKSIDNRDLDQSEIDKLLGFAVNNKNDHSELKGIKAMVDKALDTYERLPMLEVVFEKFIRLLSTSLRNLTEDNVDLEIKTIQSLRFGTYISSIPMPALVNVFRAEEWDHYGLMVADSSLIFSLVDILFGGKKIARPTRIEGRPYTSIEQSLVRQLANIVLVDLADSFASLSPIKFKFERMESDPRFASIARQGDSVVMIKVAVEIEEKKGKLDIVFPYEALESIKDLLTQVFIGDQFGGDILWQKSLINRMFNVDIKINAVLNGRPSFIGDVAQLSVGSVILMENSTEDDIALMCNNIKIASGKLGKIGKNMAVLLNSSVSDITQAREKDVKC